MYKSRRKTVRIISFVMAVVVALSAWGIANAYKVSVMKLQMRASRERALTQLGTYLDDIDINLYKCMYASSEQMLMDIASKLWRSSSSAKESLSEITDGNTEISGVYKFLSQVGEYTLSLNNKIAAGQTLTREETENLKKLKGYSEKLSQTVNYLIAEEESGGLDFEQVKNTLQSDGDEKLYLGNELNDTNQVLEDYPTLIYDGPFSDHIANKKSVMLEKAEKISQQDALKKAADFLEVEEDKLYFSGKTDSNLSTYNFYTADASVCVTQKGGFVSFVLSSRAVGEAILEPQKAIKKAMEYLGKKGYENIKESYYSITDGVCTVNFAYYENGVTYYTDLIKVSVALDNGEVIAFDATGYLMNHTKRKIPENIKYTLKSGEKLLKDGLTVIASKKAYIPTEWETEEYTYEYRCKDENSQEVLIYIDPVTGAEKDILILLYSDRGVLTK
jgi:germination protein YpeB